MKHANDVLPSIVHVDTGSLNLGVRSLLNHTMSHCDKIESDELSEVARSTGIFKYTKWVGFGMVSILVGLIVFWLVS